MLRALFPRWLWRASFRADVWFLLFNLFASALLLGWTVISSQFISNTVAGALADIFGVRHKTGLNDFTSRSIVTVSLFLAYELAYWIDHYLSHRIPVLWEFHKVHHTAEVLSPITNFRVHPVDSVVFYNIVGLFLGTTAGALSYLQLGSPFAVGGANAIFVAFIFITVHLQHSHVWIAATGPLGRVILSPAHHQIHHSDNPIHFDKNFGGCLSLWDWVFGTLHMPERKRERLNFGVVYGIGAQRFSMMTGLSVTEAENARGDMFDSDRLETVAGKSMSMDDIFAAVADFCGGTPLNDDCTIIELVYSGTRST